VSLSVSDKKIASSTYLITKKSKNGLNFFIFFKFFLFLSFELQRLSILPVL